MSIYKEKHNHDFLLAEVSAGIERIKFDVSQNTISLSDYDQKLREHVNEYNRKGDRSRLTEILVFFANVPANVLRKLSRCLRRWIRKTIQLIRRSTWRLPRALVGDVIRFEDALGRRSNLPYQYFKQWELLKPYIAHIFRGLPGDYQVHRDQYCLTVGHKKRLTSTRVWNQLIRPGDYVHMSVVSTIPHATNKQQKCPGCNLEFPIDHIPSTCQLTCSHCNREFQFCRTPSYRHVKPSDGDRNTIPMTAQKRSKLMPGSVRQPFRSALNDQTDQPLQQHNTTTPTKPQYQLNLGVSLLKNIVIHSTNDPVELANKIEDLLDQALTISHDVQTHDETTTHKLRTAVNLIRDEATRTSELNYLDFASEHREFTTHARTTITHLEQQILTKQTHKESITTPPPHARQGTTTSTFSTWVLHHYHNTPDPGTPIENTTLLLVKTLTGRLRCFRVTLSTTVSQLKTLVWMREGVPVAQQYFVYNGRKLEDEFTVAHYGMGPRCYVHVLLPIWYAAAGKG